MYFVALSGQLSPDPIGLPLAFLAPPVAANLVLVAVLLWWPARRAALVNWFFRLKGFPADDMSR